MNFRRQRRENLEINITPMIDVVFLLLIFFMVTTTFNRETELQIQLPEATGEVFLGRSVTTHKNVSEATMQSVDIEIRRIIDQQYALARKLIEENRDKIEAMAKALLEWETIDSNQIKDIMEDRPPRPPKPAQTAPTPPKDDPAPPGAPATATPAPAQEA